MPYDEWRRPRQLNWIGWLVVIAAVGALLGLMVAR
jgi:hypothetical protein